MTAVIGLAALLMQFIRLSLFQFRYTDLRVWSAAVVVVLVTASVGALIPAWRAGRVDPVTALRVEK
jgi:ABC-type antimicrobial peptide transport system permease subunit